MILRPFFCTFALACAAGLTLSAQDAASPAPAVAATPVAPAASAATAAEPAKPAANAAEAYANLQKSRDSVEQAQSREEALAAVKKTLAEADVFAKTYPADPKHWDAKLLAMTLRLEAAQLTESGPKDVTPDPKQLEEVLAAADASPEAKSEAAYLQLMSKAIGTVDPAKPETLPPFFKSITAYLDNYAASKRAPEVAQMQLQLLRIAPETPGAEDILKHLAGMSNPEIADQAKEVVAQRDRMGELKKKPVDIKFTSTEGKEIDLANLRGKVVLVDFWASWCGPCMAEAPNVVATYKKLHDKGFEIVGISLDEDKDAMQAALKKQGMTWPQYFDGTGWENKISKGFGIDSIPAAWVLDKKGMLRETEVRGEALGASVEKLLAE